MEQIYYHVVPERPMKLHQKIVFDNDHYSELYNRVYKCENLVNKIYKLEN